MSEVQGEGTVIEYNDVCLKYRVGNCYSLQWCVSEVHGEGTVSVYSDVCLKYRVRELLHFTVMCFWVTGLGNCYCVQWCVFELQGEGTVTLYSDVCLKYMVRELLLFTVMCVWCTGWGNVLVELSVMIYDKYVVCFYWHASEWGKNFRCFTQYNPGSSVRAGSIISGFSKWDSKGNIFSYASNTLRCVLGWFWELLIVDWIVNSLYFDTLIYQSCGPVAHLVLRLTKSWTVRDPFLVVTRFSAIPDRPWGPPSLLYNGYRIFLGGKLRPGRAADHSPPPSAAVMEEYSYTSTQSLGHTGPVKGSLYLYLFI